MKDLVIVGAGGHGREILQCVADINARASQWKVLGFVDDGCTADRVGGMPLLGKSNWLAGRDCNVVVAIGAPAVRCRVVRALEAMGVSQFASLVHPSAQVGATVEIGAGCMICAGAIVTTDIAIGRHAIINTGAVVSHDCRLADFVTLAPRACLSGAVQLGEGADLGAGCTLVPGVGVGDWAAVGAGAVVISNVPSNDIVAGVPARSIRTKSVGWQGKR